MTTSKDRCSVVANTPHVIAVTNYPREVVVCLGLRHDVRRSFDEEHVAALDHIPVGGIVDAVRFFPVRAAPTNLAFPGYAVKLLGVCAFRCVRKFEREEA